MMIRQLLAKKWLIVGIVVIVLVMGIGVYIGIPKEEAIQYYLNLNGEEDIVIYQGMEYVEAGYKAYDSLGNEYPTEVMVEGDVNSTIVGEYVIKYQFREIEKKRTVTVLAKSSQVTFLVLLGDKVVYLESGMPYVEPGYNVIDSYDVNLKDKVEVTGEVDVNTPGTYKIIYSVKNSMGVEFAEERTVIVRGRYQVQLKGDSRVKVLAGQKYVDEGCIVVDERGNLVDLEVKVLGNVDTNRPGTYTITYSIEYRGYQEEVIRTVEVYKLNLKCSGTINRYGTTLTVSGDTLNSSDIWWYIDGVKAGSGLKKEMAYQKVSKAYVVVNGDQINCSITNKLAYNFYYDANNTKSFIGCNSYTINDKNNLENTLKQVVNEGGYGTRAGVVEAARFLVGGLKYKIPYLGPKKVNYNLGRYEKVGLNIASNTGWGCSVSGWTQGMDCTNFVNWAFVQAGLKVKNVYSTTNVYSIGNVVNKLQVGDLLLTPGGSSFTHVGIIIGIDSSSIYVAEATTGSINAIVTTRMDKNNLPTQGKFSKARLYEYEQNGNVTNMWVD